MSKESLEALCSKRPCLPNTPHLLSLLHRQALVQKYTHSDMPSSDKIDALILKLRPGQQPLALKRKLASLPASPCELDTIPKWLEFGWECQGKILSTPSSSAALVALTVRQLQSLMQSPQFFNGFLQDVVPAHRHHFYKDEPALEHAAVMPDAFSYAYDDAIKMEHMGDDARQEYDKFLTMSPKKLKSKESLLVDSIRASVKRGKERKLNTVLGEINILRLAINEADHLNRLPSSVLSMINAARAEQGGLLVHNHGRSQARPQGTLMCYFPDDIYSLCVMHRVLVEDGFVPESFECRTFERAFNGVGNIPWCGSQGSLAYFIGSLELKRPGMVWEVAARVFTFGGDCRAYLQQAYNKPSDEAKKKLDHMIDRIHSESYWYMVYNLLFLKLISSFSPKKYK